MCCRLLTFALHLTIACRLFADNSIEAASTREELLTALEQANHQLETTENELRQTNQSWHAEVAALQNQVTDGEASVMSAIQQGATLMENVEQQEVLLAVLLLPWG